MLDRLFPYFGSKRKLAPLYPTPRYDTIIEPFAGAAGYSLFHHHKTVILIEKSPVLASLWKWLIKATPDAIRSLPHEIIDLRERDDLTKDEKSLIGFWLNNGSCAPRNIPSAWARSGKARHAFWGVEVRSRVAKQIGHINHWTVSENDYRGAPQIEATWFIDPPYIKTGKLYPFGSKEIDYEELGEWCRNLPGQVIVCEEEGAEWLPFRPFSNNKKGGTLGAKRFREVIWTSDPARPKPKGFFPGGMV